MYRNVVEPCPRCRRSLEPLEIQAGSASGCTTCHGVWLDDAAYGFVRGEFYKVIVASDRDEPRIKRDFSTTPLQCPSCRGPLRRVTLDIVDIDVCAEHGTWFDAGELLAIARAIAFARGEAAGPVSHPSAETTELVSSLNDMFKHRIDDVVWLRMLDRIRRGAVRF